MTNFKRIIEHWKHNKVELLDDFQAFLYSTSITYHRNVYLGFHELPPSQIKLIIFKLKLLNILLMLIKCIWLLFVRDPITLTTIGDTFHTIFTRSYLIYAMIASLCVIVLIGQLAVYHLESHPYAKLTKTFTSMVTDYAQEKAFYKLGDNSEQKMLLHCNILFRLSKVSTSMLLLFVSIMYIALTVTAYQHNSSKYSSLVMWLQVISGILAMMQFRSCVCSTVMLLFLVMTFINTKMDEIAKSFRLGGLWKNWSGMRSTMQQYDLLTGLITAVGSLVNPVIGLVYCICPYFSAISSQMYDQFVKGQEETLFDKLCKVVINITVIGSVLTPYLCTKLTASVTVRKKDLAKYLYPMFASNRLFGFRRDLKIESFIARLNTHFVGFYCFNLYQITKLALYKYLLSLVTCYILISNFVNDY